MCELFGVSAPGKIQLNDLLDVFFSHGDRHPHGWGMAFLESIAYRSRNRQWHQRKAPD